MRPKHFSDCDDILYFFMEYLDECKESEKTPNEAGFAAKCFMSTRTLRNYNVDGHEFFPAMQIIFTFLEDNWLNSKILSDKFKEFLFKNRLPDIYKEKQEIDIRNENIIVQITPST